jgi:hypothetical protein
VRGICLSDEGSSGSEDNASSVAHEDVDRPEGWTMTVGLKGAMEGNSASSSRRSSEFNADSSAAPPYLRDGFERVDLEELSALQVRRNWRHQPKRFKLRMAEPTSVNLPWRRHACAAAINLESICMKVFVQSFHDAFTAVQVCRTDACWSEQRHSCTVSFRRMAHCQ